MTRARDIVLADDLTGAAEVAGVAHRHGRKVVLVTGGMVGRSGAVTVIDTDTRLLAPSQAARRVREIGRGLRSRLLFKKTDSVLRGPVRAELEALAPDFSRVLLVPANPSRGRTIKDGIYRVDGRPLHRTQFARDPHHPARTADVRRLLGPGSGDVRVLAPDEPLPSTGIGVGEATGAADMRRWARVVATDTLAAGGAEFFAALLQSQGARPRRVRAPRISPGPTLVISGSLAESARISAQDARAAGWTVAESTTELGAALRASGRAWCATALGRRREPMDVRRSTAELAAKLHRARMFTHLIIEGGATAAAIIRRLRWDRFAVLGEWAPGVVALRPHAARSVVLTLKPGSYAWAPALRAALRRARPLS